MHLRPDFALVVRAELRPERGPAGLVVRHLEDVQIVVEGALRHRRAIDVREGPRSAQFFEEICIESVAGREVWLCWRGAWGELKLQTKGTGQGHRAVRVWARVQGTRVQRSRFWCGVSTRRRSDNGQEVQVGGVKMVAHKPIFGAARAPVVGTCHRQHPRWRPCMWFATCRGDFQSDGCGALRPTLLV